MIVTAWLAVALAADPVVREDAPTVGEGITNLVQVLAVSPTHAALKVVSHWEYVPQAEEHDKGYACGYAGMEKWPRSGVTLALFDLTAGTRTEFSVYAFAQGPEDCTAHTESEKALAAAKAAFAEAGLDISAPPTAMPVADGEITIAGHTLTATSTEDPSEGPVGHTTARLLLGDQELYRSGRGFGLAMAGSGSTRFTAAYPTEAGPVFLEEYHRFSGRGGNHHAYALTPPLALPSS